MNLPRISPAAAGISEEGIKGFLEGVRERGIELHDLMIVRGGKVCYEASWYPYGEDRLHMLYSLSKAFTAVGVGFAVQEGLFAVEDTVYSFLRRNFRIRSENARNGSRWNICLPCVPDRKRSRRS